MAQPKDNRVTVRVEVVIEGGQVAAPQVAAPLVIHPRNITFPTSGGNTPVTTISGINYISASGNAPQVSGYPRQACALAYPSTSVDPTQHPKPDPGAVSTTVDSGTGYWSFNQIPGAACDNISGGADNSTLLVWYDYSTGSGPAQWSNTDHTTFHGYCPGGSGGALAPPLAHHGHLPATTLYATFSGRLAPLGKVTLKWNGAGWVGHSSSEHPAVFSFHNYGGAFQLECAGPATIFVVAAPPRSSHPFEWSVAGEAFGHLAGEFSVTIVE